MKSLFIYNLGPLKNAIAAIIDIIASVKESTKLDGDNTNVGSIIMHTKINPAVIRKLSAAHP